jgi:hypothetical protein
VRQSDLYLYNLRGEVCYKINNDAYEKIKVISIQPPGLRSFRLQEYYC